MSRSGLDTARLLMKRRKYADAITLLEARAEIYEDNFDYYFLLGTACLYIGDPGNAMSYYSKARRIKITDTQLLIGQAAIFLRRGNTDKAIRYYLDVLDNEPGNKLAAKALEFIRTKGDFDTICRWVDSGKIQQFYPPLGVNPVKVAGFVVPTILAVALFFFVPRIFFRPISSVGPRANLSSLVLTGDEKKHAQQDDLTNSVYRYILTNDQITESYGKAQRYFQDYRDNASQVELNRLLNSNASIVIKQKAHLLMSYLSSPTFDTLRDNYTYNQVAADPPLYLDCWVSWSGRIANVSLTENSYLCDLFVGYETMKHVDGIIPLHFNTVPVPAIDGAKPVRVLAKIQMDNGKIILEGKSVYQSVNDSLDLFNESGNEKNK